MKTSSINTFTEGMVCDLDPINVPNNVLTDYKTRLQELVRTDRMSLQYEIINESGPAHNKTFVAVVRMENGVTLGQGVGKTKKEAEQNAAKEALEKCYR